MFGRNHVASVREALFGFSCDVRAFFFFLKDAVTSSTVLKFFFFLSLCAIVLYTPATVHGSFCSSVALFCCYCLTYLNGVQFRHWAAGATAAAVVTVVRCMVIDQQCSHSLARHRRLGGRGNDTDIDAGSASRAREGWGVLELSKSLFLEVLWIFINIFSACVCLFFGGSGTLFWGAAFGAEQWGDVHVKLQHGNAINATQRLRGRAVGLNWIAGALLLLERQGCGLCSSFFFCNARHWLRWLRRSRLRWMAAR